MIHQGVLMSRPILAIIPARYGSTRFPGKPLVMIDGKPMIQWVFEAASACETITCVQVATDDERIAEAVTGFGGDVQMTRPDHPTGTDRVAAVAQRFPQYEVVVNIQGDQPCVTPEVLNRLVAPFCEAGPPVMSTVACGLEPERIADHHTVKVICDQSMNAIYFSRAAIPFVREPTDDLPVYQHLGLYAFAAPFLQKFAGLPAGPLENCESLEQLRALENGHAIRVSLVEHVIHEVNVPEDLERLPRGVLQ